MEATDVCKYVCTHAQGIVTNLTEGIVTTNYYKHSL